MRLKENGNQMKNTEMNASGGESPSEDVRNAFERLKNKVEGTIFESTSLCDSHETHIAENCM